MTERPYVLYLERDNVTANISRVTVSASIERDVIHCDLSYGDTTVAVDTTYYVTADGVYVQADGVQVLSTP